MGIVDRHNLESGFSCAPGSLPSFRHIYEDFARLPDAFPAHKEVNAVWRHRGAVPDHAVQRRGSLSPRCAGSRPDFAKILLRPARRRATVFKTGAVMLHGVVTGRCCQRRSHRPALPASPQIFKAAHSRREFAATVGRIGNICQRLYRSVNALARVLIFQFHSLEVFTVAGLFWASHS